MCYSLQIKFLLVVFNLFCSYFCYDIYLTFVFVVIK